MRKTSSATYQIFIVSLIFLVFTSCKTKKIVTDGSLDSKMSAKNVIKAHYLHQTNFKTVRGKIKVDFTNGDDAKSVSLSLRIKKDEAIWISAPLSIVKAYITPKRVSFYNKLDNTYFDGDFTYLSQLLGTELDFNKVQNLLLGEAIFDLRKEKHKVVSINNNYQLQPNKTNELFTIMYAIDPVHFKLTSEQLTQVSEQRNLQIDYKNYQKQGAWVLPNEIEIVAKTGKTTNIINLEFKNLQFNEKLNFPYTIPNGYSELKL